MDQQPSVRLSILKKPSPPPKDPIRNGQEDDDNGNGSTLQDSASPLSSPSASPSLEQQQQQQQQQIRNQQQQQIQGDALVDQVLLSALANPRDRTLLLKLDFELGSFMKDSSATRLVFPPMSSYNRLLVHRVAQYFRLNHQAVDTKGGKQRVVILFKTNESRTPVLRFMDLVEEEVEEEEAPAMKGVKILTRRDKRRKMIPSGDKKSVSAPSLSQENETVTAAYPKARSPVAETGSTTTNALASKSNTINLMKKDDLEKEVEDAVVDQADDENYGDWRENFQRKTLSKRPSKSLQEREEEYAKARARIFEQLEAEETKCSPANANASMINGSATANPSANESKVDTPSSSNKMSRLLSAPAFTPSASTSGAAERSRGRHTLSGQQFGDAGGGGSASASGGGGGGGGGGAMSYTRLHASKYGSGGGAAQIPRQHHYNMPYTNTQLPPHIYAQQQQHGYHRPSNPFVDPYGINTIPPYQVNPPSNMHHNNVTGWMEGRDHTAENGSNWNTSQPYAYGGAPSHHQNGDKDIDTAGDSAVIPDHRRSSPGCASHDHTDRSTSPAESPAAAAEMESSSHDNETPHNPKILSYAAAVAEQESTQTDESSVIDDQTNANSSTNSAGPAHKRADVSSPPSLLSSSSSPSSPSLEQARMKQSGAAAAGSPWNIYSQLAPPSPTNRSSVPPAYLPHLHQPHPHHPYPNHIAAAPGLEPLTFGSQQQMWGLPAHKANSSPVLGQNDAASKGLQMMWPVEPSFPGRVTPPGVSNDGSARHPRAARQLYDPNKPSSAHSVIEGDHSGGSESSPQFATGGAASPSFAHPQPLPQTSLPTSANASNFMRTYSPHYGYGTNGHAMYRAPVPQYGGFSSSSKEQFYNGPPRRKKAGVASPPVPSDGHGSGELLYPSHPILPPSSQLQQQQPQSQQQQPPSQQQFSGLSPYQPRSLSQPYAFPNAQHSNPTFHGPSTVGGVNQKDSTPAPYTGEKRGQHWSLRFDYTTPSGGGYIAPPQSVTAGSSDPGCAASQPKPNLHHILEVCLEGDSEGPAGQAVTPRDDRLKALRQRGAKVKVIDVDSSRRVVVIAIFRNGKAARKALDGLKSRHFTLKQWDNDISGNKRNAATKEEEQALGEDSSANAECKKGEDTSNTTDVVPQSSE